MLLAAIMFSINSYSQEALNYNEAIIYADKLLKEDKLIDAKAYYQQALKFEPGDEYAKKQIGTIIDKMQSKMLAEDEYYDIIDIADNLYGQNKLDAAIIKYKEALKIIPDDQYAKEKIDEILDFKSREQDKIDSFNKAMESGKAYLEDRKYDEAIEQFSIAAEIFPQNETPINEMAKARDLKQAYEQKIDQFNAKYEEAERYILIKKYAEALKLYQEAIQIMPDNKNAIEKIKTVEPLALKEEKYNRTIEKADEYYIEQDFISALNEYQTANQVWPKKSYPGDMIIKINEKLENEKQDLENNYTLYIASGDSLLSVDEYSLAMGKYKLALNLKPSEKYPQQKIDEINLIFEEEEKAKEENYKNIIASADSAFNNGNFEIAISGYNNALNLNPDDAYPKDQLKEVEKAKARLAEEQKLNDEYNNIIASADNLFSTGNYDQSLQKYNQASELKPEDDYPKTRIEKINIILADLEKQKEIDNQYNAIIQIADEQFNQDDLENARTTYNSARDIKPYETYPDDQIAIIDSTITAREREAEILAQYNNLIAEGDDLKDQQEYDLAIEKYSNAIALLPANAIAVAKKDEIIQIKENIRREQERRAAYDQAISNGDKLFNEGSFELAKTEFIKAQQLYSEEDYPATKLREIDSELERLAAEREERYANSIAEGDIFFDKADYENALNKYKIANSIKPDEAFPKQRIAECEKYIEEKKAILVKEYNALIEEAENYYNGKIYDRAILAFRKAHNILPTETYAADKIKEITTFIEENSIVDIVNSIDTIAQGATERFEFEPVQISVRKSNYIFLKAKNLSDNETKLICSYGSNSSKNGGFVIQVVEGNEYNDYIVRVGNQYKWFADDNNWLSIHSENGDVEISLLRISKAQ